MTAHTELCGVVCMTHGHAPDLRHTDVVQLAIMRLMAVGARDPTALVIGPCPGQVRATTVVTIQAIGVCGEADLRGLFAISMQAAGTMAALTIGVIGGSGRVPPHVFMADRALVCPNHLRRIDRRRAVI